MCGSPRSTRSSGTAPWSTPHDSRTVNASSPSRSSGPAAAPWSTSSTRRSRPSLAPSTAAPSTAAATTRSSLPCSTPGRGSRKSSPCASPTCAWTRPRRFAYRARGGRSGSCPLWPQTADILRALLAEREREPQSDEPVFRNHRGMRLTRFGVRYLLRKYCLSIHPMNTGSIGILAEPYTDSPSAATGGRTAASASWRTPRPPRGWRSGTSAAGRGGCLYYNPFSNALQFSAQPGAASRARRTRPSTRPWRPVGDGDGDAVRDAVGEHEDDETFTVAPGELPAELTPGTPSSVLVTIPRR